MSPLRSDGVNVRVAMAAAATVFFRSLPRIRSGSILPVQPDAPNGGTADVCDGANS
jgi:hypothetical protein